MAQGEPEAILYCLPASSLQTFPTVPKNRVRRFALSAGADSGVIDVGFITTWISITCDVDVHVLSYELPAADVPALDDWPIFAKSYHSHWISTDRYLRFKNLTGDSGSVWIYCSNR